LDAFRDALPTETPLQKQMKSARKDIDPTEWSRRMNACVTNLALLNRHILPTNEHCDSARRLVLNEVVKQVLAYTGAVLFLDEFQNSAKYTEEKFLGWGPLDCVISTGVLLNVVDDEVEHAENDDELRWATNSARTQAGG
jgi:hypothetical protein